MNLIDKVGECVSASVDRIVEKNRQVAQLNRLNAIIRNETEVINHAYIALGKQYFKMLEGTAEETDMTQICDVIKFSEKRLKKAQARYDYIKVYGVPDKSGDTGERAAKSSDDEGTEISDETCEEESADITIAVAEAEQDTPAEDPEQKAAEAVKELKKKHKARKDDDTDAEAASEAEEQ